MNYNKLKNINNTLLNLHEVLYDIQEIEELGTETPEEQEMLDIIYNNITVLLENAELYKKIVFNINN